MQDNNVRFTAWILHIFDILVYVLCGALVECLWSWDGCVLNYYVALKLNLNDPETGMLSTFYGTQDEYL